MNRRRLHPDYPLLLTVLCLVGIGIFMVFDSSFALAGASNHKPTYGDAYYYLKHQAGGAALGFIALVIGMHISYWRLRRWSVAALVGSVGLLVLVLVPHVGVSMAGSKRWLRAPGMLIQPSEIAKLGLVLFLAHIGAVQRRRVERFGSGLGPRLAAAGLLAVLIAVEPDLGTALVLSVTALVMMFVSGARPSHLAVLVAGAAGAVMMACRAKPYRMHRLLAFADPHAWYDRGPGYQIWQSLIAVGSGGLFGVGLARGTQKFFYLPAVHTDFIFATVAEETGLAGGLLVLTLFAILLYRGLVIAHRTADPFGSLVAVGVVTMITAQALLNIAVVTSSLPTTGVPLPFISFGSSSLIVLLFAVGILLNISMYPNPVGEGIEVRDGEGKKSRSKTSVRRQRQMQASPSGRNTAVR